MMDDHEEEEIVEEDISTLECFERIYNQHSRREDDNPAAIPVIPVRLNIVSPSIRYIPNWAVRNCRALIDVRVLGGGRQEEDNQILLRTIGEEAFSGCTRLRRINELLNRGVIRLGEMAFEYCRSIEGELIIPNSVVFVGGHCFIGCISITSVIFEPSSTGTVVTIRSGAFSGCTELSSATLPPTLKRIPMCCFERCTSLIDVPIPPTVQKLDFRVFENCRSLPSMDLPELVDLIGDNAFGRCTALTTVTIRTRSVDLRMGEDIFRGCTALTTLRTYPWHWGKLLLSMEKDANFLDKFFNGTLTPLHQIDLTFFGPRILEAVKDQPSLLYRVLRNFQHQRLETTADRMDKIKE